MVLSTPLADFRKMVTMIALIIASIVAWAKAGNSLLKENWAVGRASSSSGSAGLQIFYGVCIGVLGHTGIECEYITSIFISW